MKNLSVTLKMAIIGIVVIAFMMFSINFSINSMQAINTRISDNRWGRLFGSSIVIRQTLMPASIPKKKG